ncbi:ribonuclease T2-like isoform X2 [Saccostrea cucullata]|uniref:ribonuclease T2-like isoform X2 n=1 Tax=Saccostrea cuccullata TaxID=36930 RepID=UPI002ED00EF9
MMTMNILCSFVFWSCINITELVILCNSMLVFQWPRTLCLKNMCLVDGQRSNCKNEIKQSLNTGGYRRLTIHGLWELGKYTDCNNNGPAFNIDEIGANKMLPLTENFPNLLGDDRVFWKHEWERHGKKTGYTIDEYFGQTLHLYNMYGTSITNAINGDCNPGTNGMTVQGFSNCIMAKAGIEKPKIALFKEFLWEIRICFNVDFLSIPCPGQSNTHVLLKLPPDDHIQKRSAGNDPTQWSNLSVDSFAVCPLTKITKNGAIRIFARELILLLLLLLTL